VTDIGKAQGKVKAGGFCRHAIWPASEVWCSTRPFHSSQWVGLQVQPGRTREVGPRLAALVARAPPVSVL
jgi:hypothetical protein